MPTRSRSAPSSKRRRDRDEWFELILAARAAFPRTLLYFAHNLEEAETVPFWRALDAVGVTLYPPLGADRDRAGRLAAMRAAAERLDQLAARTGKTVVVGEIGLRSAEGAAASRGKAPRSARPTPTRCCRPRSWPTGSPCCGARACAAS